MSDEATLDEFVDGSDIEEEKASTTSRFWGEVPEGWELAKPDEVFDVNPNPKPDEEPNTYIEMDALDTELPWPRYFGERNASEYSGKTFTAGDTLFARITPCTENGKTALVPEMETRVGIGSTEFAVLSPNQERILPWYLFYTAKSHPVHDYAISRMRGSTGRQRVPFSVFRRELDIALPPLQEQRQIASIFHNVDQAIQKAEEIVEQLSRLKEGLVNDIVTKGTGAKANEPMRVGPHEFQIPEHWETVSITDACENLDNERIPVSKSNREDMQGDIPYYGASGCVDYVDDYLFDEPLILLAEDGENLRSRTQRVAFKITGKSWVNNHAHVLRPRDDFELDYLVEYLERLDYRPFVSGSAQPKLNQTMLNKITVPKPPIEEQQKIAAILNEVKARIEHESDYRYRLLRLKQGLMQDLLSGTVRTTDTNIEVLPEVAAHG